VSFRLNVIKRKIGIFTLKISLDELQLTSEFFERATAILKSFRSGTVGISLPLEGIRTIKVTKVFRFFQSVPVWESPPGPDLVKNRTKVTVPEITENYKPNGKSYTSGELKLDAPNTTIKAHAPHPRPTVRLADGGRSTWLQRSSQSAVTHKSGTTRPTVMRPSESLRCLGPTGALRGCTRLMTRASHVDLHIRAMSRVHSSSIFVFSLETHKLEVAQQPWDRTIEIERSLLARQISYI
jgi:hypothetical protein